MAGRIFNWAVTIFVVLALLLSTISIDEQERELQKNVKKMEQLGGGGSLEDQCSSITFEDLSIILPPYFILKFQKIGRAQL